MINFTSNFLVKVLKKMTVLMNDLSLKELARLAKLEYFEQAKKDKEFHDLIAADRAEAKYKRHYETCYEMVGQIFDFACKVSEYRELTDDLIPPKLWRDWLSLFRAGKPIFEEPKSEQELKEKGFKEIEKIFNSDFVKMDEDKIKLLDQCDFDEYKVIEANIIHCLNIFLLLLKHLRKW